MIQQYEVTFWFTNAENFRQQRKERVEVFAYSIFKPNYKKAEEIILEKYKDFNPEIVSVVYI